MSDSTLSFDFPSVSGKAVTASFEGENITSNAGFLLVSDADRRIGLTKAMSAVVTDNRQSSKVSYDITTLLQERMFAIAMGHEDANDLDGLRSDPALKLACGRAPETDGDLASQPTFSRFENALSKKDLLRMAVALGRCAVAQLPAGTKSVVVDIDETADPCHGQQELEFFNAHYGSYCYLPLVLYVTDETGRKWLLCVVLRPGKSGCRGVRGLVKRAVALLRERFPEIEIELRADALYGNDQVLRTCDKLKIDYTLGLASNVKLHELANEIESRAQTKFDQCKDVPDSPIIREFGSIRYKAGPWDKARRVIVKAEMTVSPGGDVKLNPRFVVTNREHLSPEACYAHYCGRGDIENRIKEFNLDMCGGRTSCHRFLANQCRVLLHAGACLLMSVLQEAAASTCWAAAQMGTLRLKLLKIGARIKETTRRVCIFMSSSYPDQRAWAMTYAALRC